MISETNQTYELRPYQKEASYEAAKFFNNGNNKNGLMVLPTGSGKSLIIIEHLKIDYTGNKLWHIESNGKQLTNVFY